MFLAALATDSALDQTAKLSAFLMLGFIEQNKQRMLKGSKIVHLKGPQGLDASAGEDVRNNHCLWLFLQPQPSQGKQDQRWFLHTFDLPHYHTT